MAMATTRAQATEARAVAEARAAAAGASVTGGSSSGGSAGTGLGGTAGKGGTGGDAGDGPIGGTAGTSVTGGASGTSQGGQAGGGRECEAADDCVMFSDCCNCEAIPEGHDATVLRSRLHHRSLLGAADRPRRSDVQLRTLRHRPKLRSRLASLATNRPSLVRKVSSEVSPTVDATDRASHRPSAAT